MRVCSTQQIDLRRAITVVPAEGTGVPSARWSACPGPVLCVPAAALGLKAHHVATDPLVPPALRNSGSIDFGPEPLQRMAVGMIWPDFPIHSGLGT